jgi:hypothetical protein
MTQTVYIKENNMGGGWYIYNKYRSLALKLTMALLIAMAFLMILNMIFVSPKIEGPVKTKDSTSAIEVQRK